MKHVLLATTALSMAFLSPKAFAADVYDGSLKDAPVTTYAPERPLWSGWAITGSLGYATQDYEAKRVISGEGGFYKEDTRGIDRTSEGDKYCKAKGTPSEEVTAETAIPKPIVGGCPEGYDERTVNNEAELAVFGADDTVDLVRYNLPLITSNFANTVDLETSGLQGGVEVSRRQQVGHWLFELGVGANFDAGDSDKETFATSHNLTLDPEAVFGGPYPVDPADFALTGVGTIEVEKTRDIYAIFRVAPLVSDRTAIGVGAGVVYGTFNIKGTHDFDGDTDQILSTSYDEEKGAFGWVVSAFVKHKINRNWDFGLEGLYKDFGSIDVSDSVAVDTGTTPYGAYANVNDKTEVDTSEWSVKATLSYTFGD